MFPTAGGDAEEIERFHLVTAVGEFLADGKVKLYSVDSLAGRAWLTEDSTQRLGRDAVQNQFDAAIYHEVLPAIRKDCGDDDHRDRHGRRQPRRLQRAGVPVPAPRRVPRPRSA